MSRVQGAQYGDFAKGVYILQMGLRMECSCGAPTAWMRW